jgi:hypothetical protein
MEKTEEDRQENIKFEEDKQETNKEESKDELKDMFSGLLTDKNPIGKVLNQFMSEVKNIKSEDLTKFADDLSQKAKVNLEEKLKSSLQKEGINLEKLDDDEVVKFFLNLNCGKKTSDSTWSGKMPSYKFSKSDLDELLASYKNNQTERKILKSRINILSEEQKKEFWAKYYEIPTQADIDNKLNSMSEKIEDLILESQIMRKKLKN